MGRPKQSAYSSKCIEENNRGVEGGGCVREVGVVSLVSVQQ